MAFSFDRRLNGTALNYDCARIVENLDNDNVAARFTDSMADIFPGLGNLTTTPSTETEPRYCVLQYPDCTVIALQGVKRVSTSIAIFQGYHERLNRNHGGGCNEFIYQAANKIRDDLNFNLTDIKSNLIITGHSFGGAVGRVLAYFAMRVGRTFNLKLITFGSPKVGTEEFESRCRIIPAIRWYDETDPIQWMAPHASEAYQYHALLPARFSDLLSSYVQGGFPIRLKTGGGVDQAEYTPPPDRRADERLLSWSLGWNEDAWYTHRMSVYLERIRVETILPDLPSSRPRRSDNPSLPQNIPEAVVQQGMTEAVQAQRVSAQVAVDAVAATPLKKFFRAKKTNSIPCVVYGNLIVNVSTSMKRAKAVAKRGNVQARELFARGITDLAPLVASVGAMV